jgi:Xaa-Pro aminopeptidase
VFVSPFAKSQKCSIKNFHNDLSFLHDVNPISTSEFIARRDKLGKALHAEGLDAFILEPGYTFQYYGNISQRDWEPWEPEERPFLMIIQPSLNASTNEVGGKMSFLAPSFEVGRVRMLGIPVSEEAQELEILGWEEHWNPYETVRDGLFVGKKNVKVMVDEELRDFIVRGLTGAGFKTVGLDGEVEAVRQTKTTAEIEILRAVNTGTVMAIRAMRPCLTTGLTENQIMEILDNTLLSIGFKPFFDIVLIEENAALPHGGFVTGNNQVTETSMILIDVGAHYLGYSSDVCRSFFIDPPKNGIWHKLQGPFWITSRIIPPAKSDTDEFMAQKLKVWSLVLEAQAAARAQFCPNATAASVDIVARDIISSAGYGSEFTHRVGHGIGIKAHESPYLNKGNHGTKLRAGMVFTDEPGVYILGKFGVRHEDIYLVKGEGEAENLSGGEAKGPWEP